MTNIFAKLSPFDEETKQLNVVIETPKGSRNKYGFDEKLNLFALMKVSCPPDIRSRMISV